METIKNIKLPDGNTYPVEDANALTKQQITNCITEIPQDIKLELNNGVLTLKAGSKVYIPNGFEADGTTPKFDEVVTESDYSQKSTYNASCLCFCNLDGGIANHGSNISFSGNTQPTSGQVWYNTATNKILTSSDNGQTWIERRYTLPIASTTATTNGFTSIDQIFNGFGYIGSTIFALPNVKGLRPNGRNEDGSLNNIEFTTSRVKTRNHSGGTLESFFGIGEGTNITWTSKYAYSYNEIDNRTLSNGGVWGACVCGELGATNGQITSFTPKLPFRAVDYNDLTSVVPTGTVISSASSATPTGYLYCNGSAVSRATYADLFNAIGTTYGTGDGSTTFNLPNYSNYNFVTSNSVAVKGTGKALGITNGSNYYGLQGSNSNGLYPSGNGYGVNVGTSGMSPQNLGSIAMGVTTDASKSGLNGTVSTAKINWYIKY